MDNNYYENEYLPQAHRIGKITGILGVFAGFIPIICLAVFFGILPAPGNILTAFVAGASSFAILWFVEPISYYPVLGPVGTYMAFLSGNISNMRVPCASMAQVSVGVEPGTPEGSIIATLGMAVSIVINTTVLSVGVILGSSVLAMLPENVVSALNYLLPALFGALLIQFAEKVPKHAVTILIIAILVNIGLQLGVFNFLPNPSYYLGILSSVFLSIIIALATYKEQA